MKNKKRKAKHTNGKANDHTPASAQPDNPFIRVPLDQLCPAMLNDAIYRVVEQDDPAIIALADGMRTRGWMGAMAITTDNVIVSGHRRRVAALLAGITEVVAEVLPIASADPRFPEFLVSYNQQRVKTPAEEIAEQIALTDREEAHMRLLDLQDAELRKSKRRAASAGLCVLDPRDTRTRSGISEEKQPMLDAALEILYRYEELWPLTLRQVHYRLLPLSVLRNTRNPKSVYVNDRASYQDLSRLLSRLRLNRPSLFDAIEDETRPKITWRVWEGPAPFVREQMDGLFAGYRRDLQRSQPAHVVLFLEKMTVQGIGERAARPYHIPVFVGRGYPSISSRHEIAEQFRRSGKKRMVFLIASDLDPEGENIAETVAASLRDEFNIPDITAIKIALTEEQVRRWNLPPNCDVKLTSSRANEYTAKHGEAVYELEAIEPDTLQQVMTDAIESVLDMDLLEEERQRGLDDARELIARREVALRALGER